MSINLSDKTREPAAFATNYSAQLRAKIQDGTARIAILGLGYVGLPMALEFVQAGFRVVGIDVDQARCDSIAIGKSYVEDISDAELTAALRSTRFQASSCLDAMADADAVFICVPTPLRKTKDPDLSAILAATRAVAANLRQGQIIILESTTYPGTTEEVLLPILSAGGLQVGHDFFLAFSPERVDPGNSQYSVRDITKLVGACTPAGTLVATELYRKIVETVVPVSGPRVAEAAKLLENTFRSVNIAMANEMAIVCRHLGVDVWEVIDAAATKPFGFMAHYPGPGIGGHCIPLDPHYLSWKTRLSGYEPRFISLASEINASMPRYVVDMVTDRLNEASHSVRGSRVLLLGVAYKPNVGDVRESPALEVLETLHSRGARVTYSDPHVPNLVHKGLQFSHAPLTPEAVREADCVVVLTHHRDFDYEMVVREAARVVDTRNATRPFAHLGDVRFL